MPNAPKIFQLKVTLKHARPAIWRRLQVPGDLRLGKLHAVLQDAFGWTSSHLHQFIVGETVIGMPDLDAFEPVVDERKIRLDEIAQAKSRFVYEYDFGDSWEHQVVVEKVLPVEAGVRYPRCLAGERACPPEDCGGIGG